MRQYTNPLAVVGVVGGGQLARMLITEAARMGIAVHVLDPDPRAPAAALADHFIEADHHDPEGLDRLARGVDVVTIELENVGNDDLRRLRDRGVRVLPDPDLLTIIADKLSQKQALAERGIPVPDFVELEPGADPRRALADFGYPLVQKVRVGGYDGRGVAIIDSPEQLDRLLDAPSLLQRKVDIALELGVMVARRASGEAVAYAPTEMMMDPQLNLLGLLLSPARVSSEVAAAARALAVRAVEALDGVGMFGVEMFLTTSGELMLNEIAPRTHNSGHHTLDACATSQFQQQLRVLLDMPLGSVAQLPAAMLNLVGSGRGRGAPIITGLDDALALRGVNVHLYGKAECRPGRKMGHLTVVGTTTEEVLRVAEQARQLITVRGPDDAEEGDQQ